MTKQLGKDFQKRSRTLCRIRNERLKIITGSAFALTCVLVLNTDVTSAMITVNKLNKNIDSKTLSLMQTSPELEIPNEIRANKLANGAKNVEMRELDKWREFDALRGGLDIEKLNKFFARRPYLISNRLIKVATTIKTALDEWENSEPDPSFDADGQYNFDYVPEDEMNDINTKSVSRGAKLCERMSSLGPVSVKICQTLSQRPDLVGDEACNALKTLQTANTPFDDKIAMAVIKESLNWDGPISPQHGGNDTTEKPLFAWMSDKPIAVASLGQVYKATTHEGLDVAVKVQRPDGMTLLATDTMSFKLVLDALEQVRKLKSQTGFNPGLLGSILERVARDMTGELDYYREASNGEKFEQSLNFLGFVKTPVVVEKYSTDRVLVTEWVQGNHLNRLSKEEGLAMTRMAVEACTASIVLTGFVHADPHEGNLMLDEDGNVVFLDFGLMSDVSEDVMEGFASGIQGCIAEDWITVTKAFSATGFICNPVLWKPDGPETDFVPVGFDPITGEDLGIEKLSFELGKAMKEVEGGTSRFGALATVLNKSLSPRWKMQTPPYVLLLIRTFLTLEGIAARVDPDFNIYEMAMPWAVRRSLSPGTRKGIATLRSTVLTDDDKIQWSRLLELVEETTANKDDEAVVPDSSFNEIPRDDTASNQDSNEIAKKEAMKDAVLTLLGSPEGSVLRKLLVDLDSVDLISRLLSKEGRRLRKQAVASIVSDGTRNSSESRTKGDNKNDNGAAALVRPVSKESARLRKKQMQWTRKVVAVLLGQHLRRQFKAGPIAVARFVMLFVRVGLGVVRQEIFNRFRIITSILRPRSLGTPSVNPT